jgi:CheY-like chemotaxis protein
MFKKSVTVKESLSDAKILIVEDNAINVRVITFMLHELGYHDLVVAETGQKAIDIFSPDFDLVILDLGLPDVGGVEVCNAMRKALQGKPMPIIACTAFGELAKKDAIAAGVSDYHTKPLMLADLKRTIQRWLT